MEFACKLFTISIGHAYYATGVCNDFALLPTDVTAQWMKKHRMRIVKQPGKFTVIWRTACFSDAERVFTGKLQQETMSFYLVLRNPSLVCFSALAVHHQKAYYLQNVQKTKYLHSASHVSDEEHVSLKEMGEYNKPGQRFWGVVEIDLRELMKHKDFSWGTTQPVYTVQIKPKETTWRYHILDKNFRIKNTLKVVSNDKDNYFKPEATGKLGEGAYVFRSVRPIVWQEYPEVFFSLRAYTDSGEEEVLIDKLPSPSMASLRKDGGGKVCSDVFVHV